jgi:hypothetical protein
MATAVLAIFLVALPAAAAETVSSTFPVLGYVGPGAGLGLIGSLLAVLLVVVLGLVGLVMYPLKLLLRLRRNRSASNTDRVVQCNSTAA